MDFSEENYLAYSQNPLPVTLLPELFSMSNTLFTDMQKKTKSI